MPTRSTWVKMGGGASLVGALLIALWFILKFAVEAKVSGVDLLVVFGAVLFLGGLGSGLVVSRSGPENT
jgi:hypothetical protein